MAEVAGTGVYLRRFIRRDIESDIAEGRAAAV
jgi:hypothetical protein